MGDWGNDVQERQLHVKTYFGIVGLSRLLFRHWLATLGATLLCLSVSACGPTSSVGEPVSVTRMDGGYSLTFTVAKASWHVSEVVEGNATISVVNGHDTAISGAGENVFGFEFSRIGGPMFQPVWPASCKSYLIRPDQPLVFAIEKSGTIDPMEPNAPYYREFFRDPLIRLPAGEWRITAIAQIHDGPECAGASRLVRLPIDLRVTE